MLTLSTSVMHANRGQVASEGRQKRERLRGKPGVDDEWHGSGDGGDALGGRQVRWDAGAAWTGLETRRKPTAESKGFSAREYQQEQHRWAGGRARGQAAGPGLGRLGARTDGDLALDPRAGKEAERDAETSSADQGQFYWAPAARKALGLGDSG